MATYDDAALTYDDAAYIYDGIAEAQGIAVLAGTLSAAEDVTQYVKWDTLVATDGGNGAKGTVNLRLERAINLLTTLTDQSLIRLLDLTANNEPVRAIVTSRRPFVLPDYTATEVIAEHVSALLDSTFIASAVRPAETMRVRILALWAAYASSPLDLSDLSKVASIGATLPVQNFAGVTLRQAIESTISQASAAADYYVDSLGKLHVFTSEVNNAPANIHADAPGAGQVAPESLDIDYDSGSYANRVYIQGATPAGSGYYSDTAAIAAVGMTRTAVMQAPDCETAAMAQALANMYLGRVSSSVPRGSFTITASDGWRAGQNLTVTSADHGLAAEAFRISRVTTRVARPGTSLVRSYTVEFGGSRAGGRGASADSLGTGQLVSGQLGGDSNVYITSDGLAVTDGTAVRAQIGKLPSGSYGVRIVSSSGAVLIDGNQITLTGSTGTISGSQLSGGTIPAGVALGISQTTVTSAGVKVATGGVDRVVLGDIGGSDYGLKVTNSGSTVIIDGSSNVFKIVATGTVSITGCAAAADTSCDVTGTTDLATGLTTVPAHVGFLEWVTGESSSLPFTFAATGASGIIGYSTDKIRLDTKVVSTNQTRVTSRYTVYGPEGVANDRTANTYTLRYHVLKEAGL